MSRKSFSLDFKLKVIVEAERYKGPKKDLCAKFDIALSTLSTFLKNKEMISSNHEMGLFSGKRKKMHLSCNQTIKRASFLWIKQTCFIQRNDALLMIWLCELRVFSWVAPSSRRKPTNSHMKRDLSTSVRLMAGIITSRPDKDFPLSQSVVKLLQ